MKQKAESRKIKLRFMDMQVELSGTDQDLNGQALGLLSVLIQDRLKFNELSNEMLFDEDEGQQQKSKKLQFDSMFN